LCLPTTTFLPQRWVYTISVLIYTKGWPWAIWKSFRRNSGVNYKWNVKRSLSFPFHKLVKNQPQKQQSYKLRDSTTSTKSQFLPQYFVCSVSKQHIMSLSLYYILQMKGFLPPRTTFTKIDGPIPNEYKFPSVCITSSNTFKYIAISWRQRRLKGKWKALKINLFHIFPDCSSKS
jgi:hypothetical protein